ncbi:MAG: hypothetical protein A2W91_04175 [Bacteroidetes bacterium GWF2_38_335]|nr:MAG: hypothetical protein A2W91_04175 [Bacteroidetes bacterium GWF2_38_335]OFY79147.1 MAG: hypothetical protein A2281_03510 [Bacteroidetes bacterium RIFOXYA12_FULL_38_20]HBS88765.1 hypothetical protein [Bacteroidales bacterium]
MKTGKFYRISIMLLSAALLLSINSYSQKDKKKKKTSEITGWNYNDPEYGDFEITESKPMKIPSSAKKYMEGIKLIEGGTFSMGRTSGMFPTEKDTSLITWNTPRRVTVSSYYISDHEVTNKEYREFVNWVKDSVMLTFLAKSDPSFYKNKEKKLLDWTKREAMYKDTVIAKKLLPLCVPEERRYYRKKEFDVKNIVFTTVWRNDTTSIYIYPDTLRWTNEFEYSFNEPLTNMYFWHPGYDNYPVVGVSYHQAMAYCEWRTKMINDAICKEMKISIEDALSMEECPLIPRFRLPTEAEWEYAALSYIPDNKDPDAIEKRYLFPWGTNNLTDEKGIYLANFGSIRDENLFEIKTCMEYVFDNNVNKKSKTNSPGAFFHTAPVKTFPVNKYGMYDMAGNVAEWVMDVYRPDDFTETFDYQSYSGKVFAIKDTSKVELTYSIKDTLGRKLWERSYTNPDNLTYLDGDIDTSTQTNKMAAYKICGSDDEHQALKKFYEARRLFNDAERMDTTETLNKKYWLERMKYLIHDAQVNEAYPDGRVVKGGSWANGPAYMQCGAREVCSQSGSSCRIGFRIAMTRIGAPIKDLGITNKKN